MRGPDGRQEAAQSFLDARRYRRLPAHPHDLTQSMLAAVRFYVGATTLSVPWGLASSLTACRARFPEILRREVYSLKPSYGGNLSSLYHAHSRSPELDKIPSRKPCSAWPSVVVDSEQTTRWPSLCAQTMCRGIGSATCARYISSCSRLASGSR